MDSLPEYPVCESSRCGPDYDGTTIEMGCLDPAEHTLVLRDYYPEFDAQGDSTHVFCTTHMVEVCNDMHVRDNTVWTHDGQFASLVASILVGKVWPSSEWSPQIAHEMAYELA